MTTHPALIAASARFPAGSIVAHRDWSLPRHARKGYQARTGTLRGIRLASDSQRLIATVAMTDGGTLETLIENLHNA